MEWSRKRFVDSNAWKMQLVSFGHLKDCGAVDVKMNGSELEEILSFMILGAVFLF